MSDKSEKKLDEWWHEPPHKYIFEFSRKEVEELASKSILKPGSSASRSLLSLPSYSLEAENWARLVAQTQQGVDK